MKIIILGAGQVGSSLAENLSLEDHDVVIIDHKKDRLDLLKDTLDIQVVLGHCSYPYILREAGAHEADMIIAVTDSDEVNMIACQVAYSLFNVPKKIARIRSPHYLIRQELFDSDHVPIDVFISPEQLITYYVQELIEYPGALQVLDFSGGLVKLIAVKLYYGGMWVGKNLLELRDSMPGIEQKVVAIFRNDRSIPVEDSTLLEVGDEVFLISAKKNISKIMNAFSRIQEPYKNIVIAGGGAIGSCLAQRLEEEHYHIKVIERNRGVCERLAERLKYTTVLHGEAADSALLESENIERADVFCAVTNDDEANIISCLQAKRLGVKQVMALITRTAYVDLIEGGSINIAISPQLATAGAILTHIRQGDVVKVHSLRRGAAEAIEAIAHGDKRTSKVVGRKLSDIKLPSGTTLGAVVRKEQVIIPKEDTLIESGDHIILFVLNKRFIQHVERLFQVEATYF